MKKNSILDRLRDRTKLETHFKVSNEMAFINLITELGYREEKMWTDEEDEILQKLCDLAQDHTDNLLRQVEKELDKRIDFINKKNPEHKNIIIKELNFLKKHIRYGKK